MSLANIELILLYLVYFILIIAIFAINKFSLKSYNIESEQFLPEDEIHYLRQIFYLLTPTLLILGFIGAILSNNPEARGYYFIIASILSTISIISILYNSHKKILNIIIAILLIPAASIFKIMGGQSPTILLIIHFIGIILSSIYLFKKFIDFTTKKDLSLLVIIFVIFVVSGFFITGYGEKTNLVNTIVLVSNAFTGNGYSIVGESIYGKITSIYLVWGGYLLSGVGTATLTAGILSVYFKKQQKEIKELKNELKEIKELLKERD